MKILGIETSCDETAAAVVTAEKEILSNIVLSQIEEHKPYGGVVPEIAARAHLEYVDGVVAKAMGQAQISWNELDAVAATAGPGLIGGVLVGAMTAKAICAVHDKPFIAVNHLEGHALTVRLTNDVEFPYLLLLASGGHCQILAVEGVGKYKLLGQTIDDAAGEAFDKVAKMLDVGFPGGPAVEKMAEKGDPNRYDFPRPMKGKPNCDFSFSGLKTAVRYKLDEVTEDDKVDVCASFQLAVCDTIKDRLKRAIRIFKEQYPEGKTLVVSGGVAANQQIRNAIYNIAELNDMEFVAPPLKLCTDNAAMIAWAGLEHFRLGHVNSLDFKPRPRWPIYK
ncbi:MAG: tRNA (adenosine(37)-N6)-threonylcarbamoyltransferase complex transferase subunit TsaD [Alphaproteobacteria bacterium]|nr:tRNA (adenosine(37)-N6)-threonylcarbamoyltransferase complex transferase subunit TsaD [Alphaproteobacteria bacterium]